MRLPYSEDALNGVIYLQHHQDDLGANGKPIKLKEDMMKENKKPSPAYQWQNHIDIVDSSPSQKAIDNIFMVDQQMLVHMDNLQEAVQQGFPKLQPIIVAEFTLGGGRFTLLRQDNGIETRQVVEPVPDLFALAKSVAHAPLGIFGCFGAYATAPKNQSWRAPMNDYLVVLKNALTTINDIGEGYGMTAALRKILVDDLNRVTGEFDSSSPKVTEKTVDGHIVNVLKKLLQSAISFIETEALTLDQETSPTDVFQAWCNQSSDTPSNPDDTAYKLIVQCQVMAASAQSYGIIGLMRKWRKTFAPEVWRKLYVIVEAEWVTRKMNSIAQCILPEMAEGKAALDEHLLIVTNLSGVDPALHFLARILEDRSAASMILTDHVGPRSHLSGQTDLLGPVMEKVIACPHVIKGQ